MKDDSTKEDTRKAVENQVAVNSTEENLERIWKRINHNILTIASEAVRKPKLKITE